jgi:spermidine synthase
MFIYIENNAGSTYTPRIWTPNRVIHDSQSKYQHITVLDTKEYGECLFLDGIIQSSKADESLYHTWLVHPAMYIKSLMHKAKRSTHLWNVLILGGGEGCTAREVSAWYRVGDITQYDIDGALIELFKGPMAHWNEGVYNKNNVNVCIKDAVEWAKNVRVAVEESRDAVIIDLTEPSEFSGDHWASILRGACTVLRHDGVLVGYMGTVDEGHCVEKSWEWQEFCRALKGSFTTSSWNPIYYRVYMPSWGGYSLFFGASKMKAEDWKFKFSLAEIVNNMSIKGSNAFDYDSF